MGVFNTLLKWYGGVQESQFRCEPRDKEVRKEVGKKKNNKKIFF